jgi:type I restriction enzyme S subunit
MKTSTSNGSVRKWRRYPAYKESGVESFGQIPSHWTLKPTKHACGMNAESLGEATPSDYEMEYVDIGNVTSLGKILSTQRFRFEDAPSRARKVVRHSDTIISTVRTYLRAIAHISDPVDNLIVSTGFAVLRPNGVLAPRFLWRAVQAHEYVEKVVTHSVGIGYPAISPTTLGTLPLWVPPLDEQCRIVAFLARETTKIDAMIAKKERLIELLQEKRTALISHAVTKGLDPTVPMKDSGIRWIGSIPHHWQLLPVRRIAKRVDVGIAEASTHAYRDTGIPIIRSTNVRRNHIDKNDLLFIDPGFAEKNHSKYLFAGDLLTTRTGANLGMTAIVPPDLDQSQCFTLLVTTLRSGFVPRFFCYFMNSTAGQFYFSIESWGAGQHNLSVPIIQEMPVAVPPLEEQTKIVQHVMRVADLLDPVVAKIRNGIERLQEYRTALISAAVTGKIDVRQEVEP